MVEADSAKTKPKDGGRQSKFKTKKHQPNSQTNSSRFKGEFPEMHGNVFECPGECKVTNQYEKTRKALLAYATEKLSGSDIIDLLKNEMEVNFDDMVKDLGDPGPFDKPTKETKIWEKKYDAILKRETVYQDNKKKIFQVAYGQCSMSLRQKLKGMEDWTTVDSSFNVLRLLNLIKAVCHRYESKTYCFVSSHNTLLQLLSLNQGDDESLQDYHIRCKNLLEVLKQLGVAFGRTYRQAAHCWGLYNNPVVTGVTTVPSEGLLDVKYYDLAENRAIAYAFLRGANRSRYGSMKVEMSNRYNNGYDEYPTSLDDCYSRLLHYKGPKREANTPNTKFKGKEGSKDGKEDNGAAHPTGNEQPADASFIQDNDKPIKCFNCGQEGHKSPACPEKKKKANQFLQEVDEDGDDDVDDDDVQFLQDIQVPVQQATQSHKLSNIIVLDNCSTASTFCDASLVTNIRPCESIGEAQRDLQTNCGSTTLKDVGDIKPLGWTWVNTKLRTNVLSMDQLRDAGIKITWNTTDNTYKVEFTKTVSVIFGRSDRCRLPHVDVNTFRGALWMAQKELQETQLVTLLPTLNDRDKSRVKKGKRFLELLGGEAPHRVMNIVEKNLLLNCPVTVGDMATTRDVLGNDLMSLRGKTTRQSPMAADNSNLIAVPDEILDRFYEVTLCADIFMVDRLPFLVTRSRHLKYNTVHFLKSTAIMTTVYDLLKAVIGVYKSRGFRVKYFYADGAFACLRDRLLGEHDITYNPLALGEHVPDIERFIRVIKERTRGILNTLPYQQPYPRVLKIQLVLHVGRLLNTFPPNHYVHATFGPRTIMTGIFPDFTLHFRVAFGSYCEVHNHNTPTNSMLSRTTPAIACGWLGNIQGTYCFYSLLTGELLSRRSWTELPIDEAVINLVRTRGHTDYGHDAGSQFDFTWMDLTHLDSEVPLARRVQGEGANPPGAENQGANPPGAENQNPGAANQGAENANQAAFGANPQGVDEGSVEGADDGSLEGENPGVPEDINDVDDADMLPMSSSSESEDESENPTGVPTGNPTSHPSISNVRRSGRNTSRPNYRALHLKGVDHSLVQLSHMTRTAESYMASKQHIINEWLAKQHDEAFGKRPLDRHIKQFSQHDQISLKAGLKRFGKLGAAATVKEFQQLLEKEVMSPVEASKLTAMERKLALRILTFLKLKRDGTVKARTCINGKEQRGKYPWVNEDHSSPTPTTESVLITSAIEAYEDRHVATADIEGAFLTAPVDKRIIVRIAGDLARFLGEASSDFKKVMVKEQNEDVIYTVVNRAWYGLLEAPLLFYAVLSEFFVKQGFKVNPYDICVWNKTIDGAQCTIVVHVDDLKVSHKSEQVVTNILKLIQTRWPKLTIMRGKKHTYVGMVLNFSNNMLTVSMKSYITESLEMLGEELDIKANTPAGLHLFEVDDSKPRLSEAFQEKLHSINAKLLFVAKRGRPDILLPVAFLATRIGKADEDDWKKLKRLLSYLKSTIDLILKIKIDDLTIIKWWVDASYAVHSNLRSHTGSTMSFGKGALCSASGTQKLNVKSSTEAEIVGVSDALGQMLWTKNFLEEQGYHVRVQLMQDNQAAMKLENNGRLSAGKKSKHINIRYFFIKDVVDKGEVTIVYCPTQSMVADFFTKPLQGKQFADFRDIILGNV